MCVCVRVLLQVTALQIAALKRIGRGSKVVLLDRFGNVSKAVAKELSRRGFGRVFVVSGAACQGCGLCVSCNAADVCAASAATQHHQFPCACRLHSMCSMQ